jgi:hypothetical protein
MKRRPDSFPIIRAYPDTLCPVCKRRTNSLFTMLYNISKSKKTIKYLWKYFTNFLAHERETNISGLI